jgi:hypothetical protein
MDERPTLIVYEIEEYPLDRFLSQRRVFIEVANDLSAQNPQVIDVFANGLPGKAGRY